MNGFARNLITEWRKLGLPFAGETILVAVSGGADSVGLLAAINELVTRKKLANRFVAAHFNHRLRGRDSDADEDFVKQLTEHLRVELIAGSGDIEKAGNLEQNARLARYQFFTETADRVRAYGVLTAHTMNDRAETLLMNLIRGSGPDGLGALPAIRPLHRTNISEPPADTDGPLLPFVAAPLLIRPLVNWAKREDTEHYCHERDIDFRYDTMNEDTAFRRVRIRKMVLPLLRDMNPKIIETLARTAELLADERDARESAGFEAAGEISLSSAAELSKRQMLELIRRWLTAKRGTANGLKLTHIEAVRQLAISTKSGRVVELPGGRVERSGGHLRFIPRSEPAENA